MLARIFRRLFDNNGAGPKLRDDIVPWNAVPWENGPIAAPARAGFAPAGGLPGQVFTASADGVSYGWGDAPASVIIGKIDLLPFRVADLAVYAPGWRFCNGDLYPLSGAIGAALAALPANYRADWGVVVSGANISIPNMFYTDGRGYFLRAVDGTTRQVGSTADDTMRPITGAITAVNSAAGLVTWSNGVIGNAGALYKRNVQGRTPSSSYSDNNGIDFGINTALLGSNYSGIETAPLARFMTPAIYLGV